MDESYRHRTAHIHTRLVFVRFVYCSGPTMFAMSSCALCFFRCLVSREEIMNGRKSASGIRLYN